jgi:hypothetical protein
MATIYAKLLVLDSSGNDTYTGNSSTSLNAWGAQLEFEQNYEAARQNFYNFRYIRTTGASASFIGTRLGLDNTADATPISDTITLLRGIRLGTFNDGSVKDATDINIVYNQGLLRMTSYLSFDYMAEDYVGESRAITY